MDTPHSGLDQALAVQDDLEAAVDKALISAESTPAQKPAAEAKPAEAVPTVMTAKAAVKEPEKKLPPVATRCARWTPLPYEPVTTMFAAGQWQNQLKIKWCVHRIRQHWLNLLWLLRPSMECAAAVPSVAQRVCSLC